MAWKKGESGNPGGRPKEEREVLQLARDHSTRAIGRLAEWMDSDNARASVMACNAILDRALGKPTQPLSGDPDKPPIAIEVDAVTKLSREDRAALRDIAGRLARQAR
jgi:hypothetical protein